MESPPCRAMKGGALPVTVVVVSVGGMPTPA